MLDFEKTHALLCWYIIFQSNCLGVRLTTIGLFSLFLIFMLAGKIITGQRAEKPMLSGFFFFIRLFIGNIFDFEKTHALLCWYIIFQSNCLGVRLTTIGLFSLYLGFMLAGN